MKSVLFVLVATSILVLLGVRCLKNVRQARASGVGHFFLQWPNNFERDKYPVAFWWCVFVYTFVGYAALVAAAILVMQAFYEYSSLISVQPTGRTDTLVSRHNDLTYALRVNDDQALLTEAFITGL